MKNPPTIKQFEEEFGKFNQQWEKEGYLSIEELKLFFCSYLERVLEYLRLPTKEIGKSDEITDDVKPLLTEMRRWDFWRFAGFCYEDSEKWALILAKYVLACKNGVAKDLNTKIKRIKKGGKQND